MSVTAVASRASLARVTDALDSYGCAPRGRGDHLDARCPAHDDHRPSLSVDWRDGPGRVLVCCQYGCASEDVAAALGLTMADLYDEPRQRGQYPPRLLDGAPRRGKGAARKAAPPAPRRAATPKEEAGPAAPECEHRPRKVAEYAYTDAEGTITGWVIRRACSTCGEKSFAQARPGASGKREYKAPTVRPLYRLPEVMAAVAAGTPVHVVEGEKDADNGAAAGMVATTNAQGAGKWLPEHTEALRGAHVVIVADRDAKGYGHAVKVSADLDGVAASVRVVRGLVDQPKADLSDHLSAGHGPVELEEIDPAAELSALDAPAASVPVPAPDVAELDADEPSGTVVPFPRSASVGEGDSDDNGGDGGSGSGGAGGDDSPTGMRPVQRLPKSSWYFQQRGRRLIYISGNTRRDVGRVPRVTGVIVHRDDDGDPIRREYRLTGQGGRHRIITEDQLDKGTWAKVMNLPKPTGKDATDAFAAVIREESEAAEELPARAYYNEAGDLVMPAADAQSHGYRVTVGDEDEARAAWREILGYAAQDPKTLLVLGAFFVGPILHALDVQAHILNVNGGGQQGKSTTQKICAALMGSTASKKQKIMIPWNSSKQGIPQLLRARGFLPIALEEKSSAGGSAKSGEEQLSAMVAGAERQVGGIDGSPRESDGFWHSMALSSSNAPLRRRGQTEDLASRLFEITAPFWPNVTVTVEGRSQPRHLSKHLLALGRAHGGWPLEWAIGQGQYTAGKLKERGNLHGEIAYRLRDKPGGIAGTIAEIHAAWVVGAHMLGQALDVAGLGDVAERAAAELLADAIESAEASRVPDGQTLWDALDGARVRIADFPEASRLPAVMADPDTRAHVLGYTRPDKGELWVIPDALRTIAREAEIENLTACLDDLRRRGVLLIEPGHERARLLPRALREIDGLPVRMYRFDVLRGKAAFEPDGPEEPEDPADPSNGPQDGPSAGPGPDGPADVPQGGTGQFPLCRACHQPMTRGDLYGDGLHATCDEPPTEDPTGGWGEGTLGAAVFAAEHAEQDVPVPAPAGCPAPEPTPAPASAARLARRPAPAPAHDAVFAKPEQERAYRERLAVLAAMDPADDSDETINRAASGLRIIEAMTDDPGGDKAKDGPFAPVKFGKSAPFWTAPLPDIAPPMVAHTGWGTFKAPSDYRGPAAVLDRNAGHPSALSSLRVAHGPLEATGALQDASLPGYYKTVVHPWTRTDLPNPMGNREAGSEVWITHERMRLLAELASYGPEWWPDATILDSRTAERETSLRDLSQLIKHLRAHVIDTYGKSDAQGEETPQWAAVKEATNTKLIQILMGTPKETGVLDRWTKRHWYTKCRRTDWAHALHDKAAMNLYRVAVKLSAAEIPVLAVRHMDEIVIPAGRVDDAISRGLIKADESGRTFGTFKTKDTEEWGD